MFPSTARFLAFGAGSDKMEIINPQFDWSNSCSTTSLGNLVQEGKNVVQ